MKHLTVLSASALFGLTACNQSSRPLHTGFDPLLPPGGNYGMSQPQEGFRAGDLVRTVMDNAAFFKALPKGEADADRLLLRGTGMKVIRVNGSFLQVELDVTGEVGYVPVVMVESASALPSGSEQIYPPLPGSGEMPIADPGLMPPGGLIPTVIDPSLPDSPQAVPGAMPDLGVMPEPGVTPEPVPGAVPAPPVEAPPAAGAEEEPLPVPPVQPREEIPVPPGAPPAAKPPVPRDGR